MIHTYTFELRCVAAIEVQAISETEARQALRNFGYDSGPTTGMTPRAES